MSEANQKLDQIVSNERKARVRLFSIIAVSLALAIAGYFAYSSGESTEVIGSVKSLHSQASESDERFYVVVEIENSQTLTLEAPRELAIRPGDKVVLLKRETKLFGMNNYRFSRVEKQ